MCLLHTCAELCVHSPELCVLRPAFSWAMASRRRWRRRGKDDDDDDDDDEDVEDDEDGDDDEDDEDDEDGDDDEDGEDDDDEDGEDVEDDTDNRVAICHREGNGSYHTIFVAPQAVQRHLNHGDYLGPCNEEDLDSTREWSFTLPNSNIRLRIIKVNNQEYIKLLFVK